MGCSSECRKSLDRRRTTAIISTTHATYTAAVNHCCFTGILTWQKAYGVKMPRIHAAFCIPWLWCVGSVPTGKSCRRPQCISRKPELLLFRLSWAGSAAHTRSSVPWVHISPSTVFMWKILARNSCTAAMKWCLLWKPTYLVYTNMWVIWEYHREKKNKIHHAKQGDNYQKIPSAYVAMVHTVRSSAHKHNQVLTTLAVLLPSCLLVFLYTYY